MSLPPSSFFDRLDQLNGQDELLLFNSSITRKKRPSRPSVNDERIFHNGNRSSMSRMSLAAVLLPRARSHPKSWRRDRGANIFLSDLQFIAINGLKPRFLLFLPSPSSCDILKRDLTDTRLFGANERNQ